MIHQSSPHGIEMHIVQLFILPARAPHVEIVEPPLPEARVLRQRFVVPQMHLRRRSFPPALPQRSRDPLLQHLHHQARRTEVGFADEKMNVLWYDDVAQQREIVAVAHLPQNFQEDVATPLGSEERQSPVTTACDKVQMSQAVAALQTVFAGRSRHAPLYREGCGTPHNFTGVAPCDVLCWGELRGVRFEGAERAPPAAGGPLAPEATPLPPPLISA